MLIARRLEMDELYLILLHCMALRIVRRGGLTRFADCTGSWNGRLLYNWITLNFTAPGWLTLFVNGPHCTTLYSFVPGEGGKALRKLQVGLK